MAAQLGVFFVDATALAAGLRRMFLGPLGSAPGCERGARDVAVVHRSGA
jgi:hypothetical protein